MRKLCPLHNNKNGCLGIQKQFENKYELCFDIFCRNVSYAEEGFKFRVGQTFNSIKGKEAGWGVEGRQNIDQNLDQRSKKDPFCWCFNEPMYRELTSNFSMPIHP